MIRVKVKSSLSGSFLGLPGTLLAVDCCQPKYSQLVLLDGWKYPLWWAEEELEFVNQAGHGPQQRNGVGNG